MKLHGASRLGKAPRWLTRSWGILSVAMTAFLLITSAGFSAAATRGQRPNVLIIHSDDVGWGDFQCYNPAGRIPTPNIDRMAREGMRFTNAHTPAALCAPTRYAMLTGNYAWRGAQIGGTWGVNGPCTKPGQRTVAEMMKEAGYRTAIFGKCHHGGRYGQTDGKPDPTKPLAFGPIEWGYDYSYILLKGHQAPPHIFYENNRPDCDPAQITWNRELKGAGFDRTVVNKAWDSTKVGETLVTKAMRFFDDHLAANKKDGADRPFYIYFNTAGAHGPYTPGETLLGTKHKGMSGMTDHTDMVYEVDIIAGKLTEALRERGLFDDTLMVVTSDNGGLPFERQFGHDAVGGLRGLKSTIYEGGHRVPFIARWPGKVPADTVRGQPIGTHDIIATALDLAGAKVPADQCLDAVSLRPVLLGQRGDSRPVRRYLVVQSAPGRDADFDRGFTVPGKVMPKPAAPRKKAAAAKKVGAKKAKAKKAGAKKAGAKKARAKKNANLGMAFAVFEGNWKLIVNSDEKPYALYDLATDIGEQKNLLDDPAQAERIQRLLGVYRDTRASKRSTPVVGVAVE